MRPQLVLALLLVGTATATAAPFSIDIPASWKDTSYSSHDVDGLQATLATGGNSAEVYHHTAPNGTTVLVTFVEAYTHGSSRELLDQFQRSARDTRGTEVSYRVTDGDEVRTVVQVSERDGKHVHTRWLVGYMGAELRSAGAVCTGDTETCDPVIASLALDTTGFTKLADLRATVPPPPPPSQKLSPFELGMCLGFLVGIPLIGVIAYTRWRKNRS